MFKRTLTLSAFAAVFSLSAAYVVAADQPQGGQQEQVQQQVYGSQLMTPQERAEYRAKMRSLKTPEEREAFRQEHHRLMQERAGERGLTLPDIPPARGGGMGPGGGMMGPGGGGMMGPGGGGGMMGPGGGMGR
jgi:hypothetical protein